MVGTAVPLFFCKIRRAMFVSFALIGGGENSTTHTNCFGDSRSLEKGKSFQSRNMFAVSIFGMNHQFLISNELNRLQFTLFLTR